MLPPVFVQLKSSADVRNFVGNNPPRIWRKHVPDEIPRPLTQPYVTWFLVAGTPELNLSDPPPVDRGTVQIDCYHQTDKGCELLADAVRKSIEEIAHVTSILIDEREPETKLYRMAMQADIFTGNT